MSGSRLTLTWRRPESPARVSSFIVEAGSATGLTNIASIVVSGQALTFVPVPAGYYFLRVRAVDAVGTVGPPSREFLLNAGPVPSPPQPPPYLEAIVVGVTVTRRGSP